MTHNNEKGFMLVEVMIGMIIVVIILGGVVQVLDSSLRVQTTNTVKINDIQDGQLALNQMVAEIEYAFSNSLQTLHGTDTDNDHDTEDKDSEIYFMRTVGVNGEKETRRIYFQPGTGDKGGSVIIEKGPYPQVTNPWTFTSKTILAAGAARSLTFTISRPGKKSSTDSDIVNNGNENANNYKAKRKTVTIILVTNSKPFNSANAIENDPRTQVFKTTVTTQNMQ